MTWHDCISDGNQLFDMLEDKEQKERCEFPVANAFEEQIRWTEEGKLWKFPIDNEQGRWYSPQHLSSGGICSFFFPWDCIVPLFFWFLVFC